MPAFVFANIQKADLVCRRRSFLSILPTILKKSRSLMAEIQSGDGRLTSLCSVVEPANKSRLITLDVMWDEPLRPN